MFCMTFLPKIIQISLLFLSLTKTKHAFFGFCQICISFKEGIHVNKMSTHADSCPSNPCLTSPCIFAISSPPTSRRPCGLNVFLNVTLSVQTQRPQRCSQSERQTPNLSALFVSPQDFHHFHYRKCHKQINKPSLLHCTQKFSTLYSPSRHDVNTSSQMFVHVERLWAK